MSHPSKALSGTTIGLDVGDRRSRLCVIDAQAQVRQRRWVSSTREGLHAELQGRPRALVVLEAGTHSPWMSRLIHELGHDVHVAHPVKAANLMKSKLKTDDRDAEQLARLGRSDREMLGAPVRHRSEQQQQDRALLLSRDRLVRARASLALFVRGSVKPVGARIGSITTAAFGRKALEQIPQGLRPALVPQLEVAKELSRQIAELDRLIEATARLRYPQTEQLRQVHGVGPITSLAFVLTIHDPRRFNAETVAAYLGLVPAKKQSGEYDPQLPITHAGDRMTRRLLIECAQSILARGQDCDLRRWGHALAHRGGAGAGQRAAVAVARRLAGLLLALWKTGETYKPLRTLEPATT